MELNHKLIFIIKSDNIELRCLKPNDVSNSYIRGLRDQKEYLKYNPKNFTLKRQKDYINNIAKSESDIICGLFFNSILIGTTGIQNILNKQKPTIGIFIFSQNQRRRGLGKTILWAGSYLINKSIGTTDIYANMEKSNIPSLKSFLSCGYKFFEENKAEYWLSLNINDLLKPNFIKDYRLIQLKDNEN
jgi:RimJ/RimL family protein N-acetyltransferase